MNLARIPSCNGCAVPHGIYGDHGRATTINAVDLLAVAVAAIPQRLKTKFVDGALRVIYYLPTVRTAGA